MFDTTPLPANTITELLTSNKIDIDETAESIKQIFDDCPICMETITDAFGPFNCVHKNFHVKCLTTLKRTRAQMKTLHTCP